MKAKRSLRHRRIVLNECQKGDVNAFVFLNGSGSIVAKKGPVTIGKWTCYFPVDKFPPIAISATGTAIRYLGAKEDEESFCVAAGVAFKRAMRNVARQTCDIIEALEESEALNLLDYIADFNSSSKCG